MTGTRLEAILSAVRRDLAVRMAEVPFEETAARARARGQGRSIRTFLRYGPGIIAEIKRASPSRGWIRKDLDAAATASAYARGGACAISVLTEGSFFGGSLEDLARACEASGEVPVLRKDFLLDEYMVAESRAHGADIVLLIVAVLGDGTTAMIRTAEGYGLEALVEVHDEEEMAIAAAAGATLIGINNRDLRTLSVDPGTAKRLLPLAPPAAVKVVESGISTPGEIRMYIELGADAFLVGESLVRAGDPARAIGELLGRDARRHDNEEFTGWNRRSC